MGSVDTGTEILVARNDSDFGSMEHLRFGVTGRGKAGYIQNSYVIYGTTGPDLPLESEYQHIFHSLCKLLFPLKLNLFSLRVSNVA